MEFIWSFGAFSSQFADGIISSFLGTRQMLMHEKPWVIHVLMQRLDVASTLNRRCFNVVCLPGFLTDLMAPIMFSFSF